MSLIQLNGFIATPLVEYASTIVVVLMVIGAIYQLRKWSRVIPAGLLKDANSTIGTSSLVKLFFSELTQSVLVQRLIFMDSKSRRALHLAVFWGFVGLAVATVWDDIFYYNGYLPAPFTLQNLGNVIGNISGIVLIVGLTIMVLRYAFTNRWRQTYKGDLTFLGVLYLATITGFLTEVARLTTVPVAESSYVIHLVFIAVLIVTAPFTHFFHSIVTPLMRYIERIDNALEARGLNKYPFYRRSQMANNANGVRDGSAEPTRPAWLQKTKEEVEEK